uniref:phosphoethanolamine N-methyltransferase n=1 Tax=Saccoglossus kowalevskii TaxID=10224 RepID=A0ABM0MVT5_SACKO|nr:PREDICTED: phosphoethanolamine N-methyltransferase-like [Saccoglossus kowalevskii]
MRKSYWSYRSTACTGIERVLNVPKADELSRYEIDEILAILPPLEGKNVVDLGAGIGRYTAPLASAANHVTAVELVEEYTEANRASNGHIGNIDFITSDVVHLNLNTDCCDLVFSNYLLQYLDDDETRKFATNALKWIKPGGWMFFREVTIEKSGMSAATKVVVRQEAKAIIAII